MASEIPNFVGSLLKARVDFRLIFVFMRSIVCYSSFCNFSSSGLSELTSQRVLVLLEFVFFIYLGSNSWSIESFEL